MLGRACLGLPWGSCELFYSCKTVLKWVILVSCSISCCLGAGPQPPFCCWCKELALEKVSVGFISSQRSYRLAVPRWLLWDFCGFFKSVCCYQQTVWAPVAFSPDFQTLGACGASLQLSSSCCCWVCVVQLWLPHLWLTNVDLSAFPPLTLSLHPQSCLTGL